MFQKIIIVGRLGNDPDAKVLESGAELSTFSVATSQSYKNKKDEKEEETEWFRVIVWNKLAEICNTFLSKGSLVLIEGRLKTKTYTDKEGVKRRTTDLIASQMQMLGGNDKKTEAKGETQKPESKFTEQKPAYMDDNLDGSIWG